ncbi:hypothetical protein V7124_19385 [Neobacillus niacini]|uniref:phage tail fiber protein n=1 Tax=Neobacillus niacini TaxID=86668 RepID=UPI002FFEFC45
MSFSVFLENALLDEVFGGTNYIPSTNLYIGLSTTEIFNDGTGYTEPPGANGYSRAEVPNNPTNFPATGGDGTKSNGTTISFDPATGDWGTIGWFFIADDVGNILASNTIGTPKLITNGDTASFGPGSLTITLD